VKRLYKYIICKRNIWRSIANYHSKSINAMNILYEHFIVILKYYDFWIKTMLGSSLPPVVCRRTHVLFTFVCVSLRIVVSKTFCVLFLFFFLRLVYVTSFVSPDCPFLITLASDKDHYVIMNIYCLMYNSSKSS